MGNAGSWHEGVESLKVPWDAVTVGSDGEGESVGNSVAHPVPLAQAEETSPPSGLQETLDRGFATQHNCGGKLGHCQLGKNTKPGCSVSISKHGCWFTRGMRPAAP